MICRLEVIALRGELDYTQIVGVNAVSVTQPRDASIEPTDFEIDQEYRASAGEIFRVKAFRHATLIPQKVLPSQTSPVLL